MPVIFDGAIPNGSIAEALANIQNAIGLVYRGGSVGSLGVDILSDALVCLTATGAESEVINGSGRLSFDRVEDIGNSKYSVVRNFPAISGSVGVSGLSSVRLALCCKPARIFPTTLNVEVTNVSNL